MSVVVVGLEHQQAPLDLLERVTVADADAGKVLGVLRESANIQEAVLLSTCLRTEVYAVVDRFHDAVDEVQELLAGVGALDVDDFRPYVEVRFDDEVPEHLFAVASGLESAIIGESEILGQVRRSLGRSHEERTSGPVLAGLFRHAVRTGKRVRSETAIGRGAISFAHAAVAMADRRLPQGLGGSRVVVVGAGSMGSGLVRALQGADDARPAEIVVANRTPWRAEELAASARVGVRLRITEMTGLLASVSGADAVFTAVSSPTPIFGRDDVLKLDRHGEEPLLVVDLGMPRNCEANLAELPGVDLLGMDDLRNSVDAVVRDRLAETEQARVIVNDEVDRYHAHSRARGAAPVVAAFRSRLEDVRLAELERQRGSFGELSDADWSRIDSVTRSVLAKLVHEPTLTLKYSAGTPRGERLVEALRILFDL